MGASPPPEHVKHAHVGAFYMFGGRGCRKGTQHENAPMQGTFSCWASRGVQRRVGRHPNTKIMPMGHNFRVQVEGWVSPPPEHIKHAP